MEHQMDLKLFLKKGLSDDKLLFSMWERTCI